MKKVHISAISLSAADEGSSNYKDFYKEYTTLSKKLKKITKIKDADTKAQAEKALSATISGMRTLNEILS
jgi:hypothetical protein